MSEKQSFAEKYGQKSSAPSGPSQEQERVSFAQKHASQKDSGMSASAMQSSTPESRNATSSPEESADPQKASKSDLVYLVKGVDDGKKAWYYVLVERLKLSLFLKALNDDIIHLENYGIILDSAYGEEPPANVTSEIKKEYGIK